MALYGGDSMFLYRVCMAKLHDTWTLCLIISQVTDFKNAYVIVHQIKVANFTGRYLKKRKYIIMNAFVLIFYYVYNL